MNDRDIIRRALSDAIDWQSSLADATRNCPHDRKECLDLVKKYRSILKRRYTDPRTIKEINYDSDMKGARVMSLDELRAMHSDKGNT